MNNLEIDFLPLNTELDQDFLSGWSVSSPAEAASILRLTEQSAASVWDLTLIQVPEHTENHWALRRDETGPSYSIYSQQYAGEQTTGKASFEEKWLNDVTSFFQVQLRFCAEDPIFWIVSRSVIYATTWRIFLKCLQDFRPESRIAILLGTSLPRFGAIDSCYNTWVGDFDSRSLKFIDIDRLKSVLAE